MIFNGDNKKIKQEKMDGEKLGFDGKSDDKEENGKKTYDVNPFVIVN